MRVVIISHLYPSSVIPNVGHFIYNHALQLHAQGVQALVLQPVPSAPAPLNRLARWKTYDDIARSDGPAGPPIIRFRYLHPPGSQLQPAASLAMVPPLLKILRQVQKSFSFDLLHAHTLTPDGFAAVEAGRMLGKPVICSARGSDVHTYPQRSTIAAEVARRALRRCDQLVVVSQELGRQALQLEPAQSKPQIIYNGVDIKRFRPAEGTAIVRLNLGLDPGRQYLITVGALIPEKGILELIEAFEALARIYPDLGLIVLGEGPLRENLRALDLRLGNQGRVIAPGKVGSAEVANYLKAADILVHPSHAEGLPNAVLEGMASALPVVASAVGGTPEVVVNAETGFLVPPRAAKEIFHAIRHLLDDPVMARCMGERGKEHVTKHHSWSRNAQEHAALYWRVLASSTSHQKRSFFSGDQ